MRSLSVQSVEYLENVCVGQCFPGTKTIKRSSDSMDFGYLGLIATGFVL